MYGYKYSSLVNKLESEISCMCGVGTKYVKLFLNSKSKNGDYVATFLRNLLECETLNVNAKRYRNTTGHNYKDNYYKQKYDQINHLISLLLKDNTLEVKFGYQRSDTPPADYIVYFQHKIFGQISFHTDLSHENLIFLQQYEEPWDEIKDSSLYKLEACIYNLYGKEILEKYKDKTDEIKISNSTSRIQTGNEYILRSMIMTGGFEAILISDIHLRIGSIKKQQVNYP